MKDVAGDDKGADGRGRGGHRRVATGKDTYTGYGPDPGTLAAAPDRLTEIPARSWRDVLKRTLKEFREDELTDRAAALTYYGVLAVFPALLVLVALLGFVGESATRTILDNLQQLTPGATRTIIGHAVTNLQHHSGTGGVLAIAGLLGALWSASGYVAGFIRAANAVYDVREGRPAWKIAPIRLGVTLVLMVLLAASAVIVVFTGGIAQQAGRMLGIGPAAVTAWSIAKWPVLVVLVVLMIGVLYWAAPNARQPGFRWTTAGGFLAVVLWLVASAGFAVYVANFGSYNKTYGTLAGVVVFLVWLWLSNLAILLGLELDAEIVRQRAIAGGFPVNREPYVQPRDTRAFPRPRTGEPGTV